MRSEQHLNSESTHSSNPLATAFGLSMMMLVIFALFFTTRPMAECIVDSIRIQKRNGFETCRDVYESDIRILDIDGEFLDAMQKGMRFKLVPILNESPDDIDVPTVESNFENGGNW